MPRNSKRGLCGRGLLRNAQRLPRQQWIFTWAWLVVVAALLLQVKSSRPVCETATSCLLLHDSPTPHRSSSPTPKLSKHTTRHVLPLSTNDHDTRLHSSTGTLSPHSLLNYYYLLENYCFSRTFHFLGGRRREEKAAEAATGMNPGFRGKCAHSQISQQLKKAESRRQPENTGEWLRTFVPPHHSPTRLPTSGSKGSHSPSRLEWSPTHSFSVSFPHSAPTITHHLTTQLYLPLRHSLLFHSVASHCDFLSRSHFLTHVLAHVLTPCSPTYPATF